MRGDVSVVRQARAEDPTKMSDSQLTTYIESRLVKGRMTLISLKPWLMEARQRYSQPGRRVPVPGHPSFTEWIRTATGYSDRWVRMVLSDDHQKHTAKKRPKDKSATFKMLADAAVELATLVAQGSPEMHELAKEILRIQDEELPKL